MKEILRFLYAKISFYKERKITVNLLDRIMLKQIRERKAIRKLEWPPKSPEYSPLNNHILNALKVKVYK